MTTLFEDSPQFGGICGDYALVTGIKDRVVIRAVDTEFDEDASIAMTPEQARALAQGIIEAADRAEGKQ